ncbi:MAG TPA: STAS domain-containing protein [Nocardioides sp.]|jgi:anti-anti-sigma factor|uniref:STAS domain-containing protein n=1 Tax=Nocardioides sp. TaxID=35761 RepID=UPI002BB24B51|nr:STAS domain-containing protein [Nocardioides sp.]HTW13487.1 STAS domain-containing protein [Nocardioides sp.]
MIIVQQPASPPIAHFTFSGDLDVFGARALRRRLSRASRATCTDLRVDLGGVDFVDVSALGELARTWSDLGTHVGTTVSLVGVSRPVRRLRAAAGLTEQLPDAPRPGPRVA